MRLVYFCIALNQFKSNWTPSFNDQTNNRPSFNTFCFLWYFSPQSCRKLVCAQVCVSSVPDLHDHSSWTGAWNQSNVIKYFAKDNNDKSGYWPKVGYCHKFCWRRQIISWASVKWRKILRAWPLPVHYLKFSSRQHHRIGFWLQFMSWPVLRSASAGLVWEFISLCWS